jgi:general secretion pathway protein D
VSSIPVIGKLFGDNSKRSEEREVIISLTPRIVRAPKVTEADLVPLPVGTQAVPKVPGAGPGLFGPEPEEEAEAPPEGGDAPPAAQPVSPPSRTPDVAPRPEPVPVSPPPGASPAQGAEAGTPPEAATDVSPVNVLFSPPELATRVGETASVAVVIVGARNLEWVELEVAWDGGLAEIAEASPGSLLTLDGSPVAAARTLESGRARVRFSRSTGASGSGAVVSLTFKGLREGSGSLTVQQVSIGAGGATASPAPPPPGRIVVAP